jgi:nitrogen regulatory protein PII
MAGTQQLPLQMPPATFADQRLVTCILPHGIALDVLRRLKYDQGVVEAMVGNARGMGKLTPLAHRGVGDQTEKEILNVVVPSARADELFDFIRRAAQIDRPHGGIIFMCRLQRATPFTLPDLPEET